MHNVAGGIIEQRIGGDLQPALRPNRMRRQRAPRRYLRRAQYDVQAFEKATGEVSVPFT